MADEVALVGWSRTLVASFPCLLKLSVFGGQSNPRYQEHGLGGTDNTCPVVDCWDMTSIFMATLSLDHLGSVSALRLQKSRRA